MLALSRASMRRTEQNIFGLILELVVFLYQKFTTFAGRHDLTLQLIWRYNVAYGRLTTERYRWIVAYGRVTTERYKLFVASGRLTTECYKLFVSR